MKNAVPHVAAFLVGVIWPMILSSRLVQTCCSGLADAIARKIMAERMWQCKTRGGRKGERCYASQSRTSAIAAGGPPTHKNLRPTGAGPQMSAPITHRREKNLILEGKPGAARTRPPTTPPA